MAQITFEDKVTLNELPEIAEVNKLTAANVNEIKQVINSKADLVDGVVPLQQLPTIGVPFSNITDFPGPPTKLIAADGTMVNTPKGEGKLPWDYKLLNPTFLDIDRMNYFENPSSPVTSITHPYDNIGRRLFIQHAVGSPIVLSIGIIYNPVGAVWITTLPKGWYELVSNGGGWFMSVKNLY